MSGTEGTKINKTNTGLHGASDLVFGNKYIDHYNVVSTDWFQIGKGQSTGDSVSASVLLMNIQD